MARKFISVLGAGKYSICNYCYGDEIVKNRYIQKALTDIFCKDWTKTDKVIVFTTKEAEKNNWFGNLEEGALSLSEELSSINADVSNIEIPKGDNEEKQWELFEIIFNSLENEDEVIVDITNGFRTIPMFLIIILSYAKVLKNIKVLGIYYGAYEDRKLNEEGVEVTPIFDLTMYDLLMDITNGINTFLKTGNSTILTELCNEINNQAYRNNDKSLKNMNMTVKSLNNFAKAIMTCRGNIMIGDKDKSIYWAYKQMEENLNQYENSEDMLSKALNPLFEKVKEETKNFDDIDVVKNGISTVEWCIKKGFIQQGITALEETIKTFTCIYINKRLNKDFDVYEEEHREAICNTILNSQRFEITEKEKYYELIIEILNSGIIPESLLTLEIQISDLRNDANHFGMRKEKINAFNKMETKLKTYFKKFLLIIEELS
ncbi:TIGR02221 family CRISPR-associated protein [Clostridium sp. B9]|uniref:TIGR02221 family CRISPR-associated protein n=1 Tax=Clostridium sp. B9 TaxID=3423224 RepID=UPI003D2EF67E